MGSSLSSSLKRALGLWRKTQGGEPGAPGFDPWLYSVAGAAAAAVARRRAGCPWSAWQQPAGGQFLRDPYWQIVPQKIALNVIALGFFGIALGFAVVTLKTALIGHPVLRFPASGVTVTGFVELREESQHTDRFVDGGRIEEPPRRAAFGQTPHGAGGGIIH